MRTRVGIGLFAVTSVVAASLSVAVTADSGANPNRALSDTQFADVSTAPGSQVALAGGDDPDAPIRTGRWAEDRPPVQLAGGPAPSVPNSSVIRLASAPPPTATSASSMAPRPITMAALLPPDARASLQPTSRSTRAALPRITLALGAPGGAVNPGSGLAIDRDSFDNPAAPRVSRPPPRTQSRGLLVQLQAKPDRRKGRWFIFAAGSGEAYGFNLIRDPFSGWKKSGWSVEQLAEFGKAQIGIGWRKGRAQIAATAARREIGAYGISREDTVFGLTFSLSGAKPTARPRGGIGRQPSLQSPR
ncbi:hypothetical protein QO010_001434 [Caulobacter ginsengisoli]|uniref:Uncharacterized protein n=1 Tax=Caulobacter ginsengisoli TaxID=400775 RepID=A0ABU0IR81_9CAUL|nr:hypothetical protein [Caulobacter ginsengisoli]MDQ0463663.1 hypothetical protein [Caulobacter ginsengisoli]